MATYDDWKTTAPESDDEVCGDCGVCYGGDGPPCSPECERIVFLAKQRSIIRGLYESARMSLRLARRYRGEEGAGARRERECVLRVRAIRDVIRVTRTLQAEDVDAVLDVALSQDLAEAAQ